MATPWVLSPCRSCGVLRWLAAAHCGEALRCAPMRPAQGGSGRPSPRRSPAATPADRYAVWPTMRSTVTVRAPPCCRRPTTQMIMPCCAGSTAAAGTDSMRRLDLDRERNLHGLARPQHLIGVLGNDLGADGARLLVDLVVDEGDHARHHRRPRAAGHLDLGGGLGRERAPQRGKLALRQGEADRDGLRLIDRDQGRRILRCAPWRRAWRSGCPCGR